MSINKTFWGLLVALVLPFLAALGLWRFGYNGILPFYDFVMQLAKLDSASTLIAVCALPNLAIFILFVNIKREKFARGVFLATLLYAFLIMVFKFGIQ